MKYPALLSMVLIVGCSGAPPSGEEKMLGMLMENHKITPWKYNAAGAYSMIFDDYCFDEARGIQNHAFPEANQRGIVFGFGVVTSTCDAHEWQLAREMLDAGHEVINHSHTHRCGLLQEPWCTDVWNDTEVDEEIDLSTHLIMENTGTQPRFFIFPFDLFTPKKLRHLQQQGYVGARAGDKKALNLADFYDPFALNFDVMFPPDSIDQQGFGLNKYVDEAIARGQLAFRAFHGVNDESWGTLTIEKLREHFDYIQVKQASHQLWVATITDIIYYNQARRTCQLEGGVDAQGIWLRLESNAETCLNDIELSVTLPAITSMQLTDSQGEPMRAINGTYTMLTGYKYRFFIKSDKADTQVNSAASSRNSPSPNKGSFSQAG